MDFDFNCQNIWCNTSSKKYNTNESSLIIVNSSYKQFMKEYYGYYIKQIINSIGKWGSVQRRWKKQITSSDSFFAEGTNDTMVIKCKGNYVYGYCRVGYRNIFIKEQYSSRLTRKNNVLCVIDFFVHFSKQRSGIGKEIMNKILDIFDIHPKEMGYYVMNEAMEKFLEKNYFIRNPVKTENEFWIYLVKKERDNREETRLVQLENKAIIGKNTSQNNHINYNSYNKSSRYYNSEVQDNQKQNISGRNHLRTDSVIKRNSRLCSPYERNIYNDIGTTKSSEKFFNYYLMNNNFTLAQNNDRGDNHKYSNQYTFKNDSSTYFKYKLEEEGKIFQNRIDKINYLEENITNNSRRVSPYANNINYNNNYYQKKHEYSTVFDAQKQREKDYYYNNNCYYS